MSSSMYKNELGDDWRTHCESSVRTHLFRPGFREPYKAPCGYQGVRVTPIEVRVTCETCLRHLAKKLEKKCGI